MKYIKTFENMSQSDIINTAPLINLINNEDIELISKILRQKKSGDLLEIACGNGSDAVLLSSKGFNVTCIEKNQKYVDEVNRKGIKCIRHDISQDLLFRNDTFDVIYSRLGMHYFTKNILDKIFNDIYRVCKLNGIFVFTVKIENDSIQTNKVILKTDDWDEITKNSGFHILSSDIKEGLLYGSKSTWYEMVAKK